MRPPGAGHERGHRRGLVGRREHARPGARARAAPRPGRPRATAPRPARPASTGRPCRPAAAAAGHRPRPAPAGRGRRSRSAAARASPRAPRRSSRRTRRPSPGWPPARRGARRPAPARPSAATSRPAVNPGNAGSSSAPGQRGQPRRAGREPGRLAEEVDLDPGAGEVAVGQQADHAAAAQPPGQRAVRAPAVLGRDHLEAQRLPVGDEPAVQRLRVAAAGPPW